MNKVCFVGLGYVGLPTAALLASKGLTVHGFDTNKAAVDLINEGKAHIEEKSLEELVAAVVGNGKLKADIKPTEADVFIIAVPTPFNKDKSPDMTYVLSAGRSIAPFLRKGNLVILESTSPVGSTAELGREILALREDLSGAEDLFFAYCPERILPGDTIGELTRNSRSIGGLTREAALKARELYEVFCKGELIVTDAKTAEMSKLVENSFRDVNIAFANEISIICDKQGIDVAEVIRLANRHPRVKILSPGVGVGGHCIPVDPWFIVAANPEEAKLIKQARLINDFKPIYVAKQALKLAKALKASKIVVLGLAYKPDVDDFRESSAFTLLAELIKAGGFRVFVHDPFISKINEKLPESVAIEQFNGSLEGKAVYILATPHKAYLGIKKSENVIDPSGSLGCK